MSQIQGKSSKKTPPSILILGSGLAGLTTALKAAEFASVVLVTKDDPMEGATRYAQGGIASVWSKLDSFDRHATDTRVAGDGLCRESVVQLCVTEGPDRVRELIDWGVPFSRREGVDVLTDPAEGFDLHREGGHSARRILHSDDLTGLAIEQTLWNRVKSHPNIQVFDHHMAIDLITQKKSKNSPADGNRVLGAFVLNTKTRKVETLPALATVLATGGVGKVYLYTSNPDTATGDGMAMAYRAGARVANLEFMQFHPTCLYHAEARTFLISEALRGEGAVLRNQDGEEFMKRYHPMGSLASRDIVARAIDSEMKRRGDACVYLDARHLPDGDAVKKFPNISERLKNFGFDLSKDLIPVVPAAHYMCGGVLVDEQGATTLPGLYAVGETACTGLHGANRLASNSLLEAVVFSDRAVRSIQESLKVVADDSNGIEPLPEWSSGTAVELEDQIDIAATWREVRTLMWNYVGIVRSDRRLERADRRLQVILSEVMQDYWAYLPTRDLLELRNLVLIARLIVRSASVRKESRGLHYTVDYPTKNDRLFLADTIL